MTRAKDTAASGKAEGKVAAARQAVAAAEAKVAAARAKVAAAWQEVAAASAKVTAAKQECMAFPDRGPGREMLFDNWRGAQKGVAGAQKGLAGALKGLDGAQELFLRLQRAADAGTRATACSLSPRYIERCRRSWNTHCQCIPTDLAVAMSALPQLFFPSALHVTVVALEMLAYWQL